MTIINTRYFLIENHEVLKEILGEKSLKVLQHALDVADKGMTRN